MTFFNICHTSWKLFPRYLIKFFNELTFEKSLLNEKHYQNSNMMKALIKTTNCLQATEYRISHSSINHNAVIQSNCHFSKNIIIPFIWYCAYIIGDLTKLKVCFLPIFENLINQFSLARLNHQCCLLRFRRFELYTIWFLDVRFNRVSELLEIK